MQRIHQTSKIKIRGKREKRREKVEIRSEFRIIENGKRQFIGRVRPAANYVYKGV